MDAPMFFGSYRCCYEGEELPCQCDDNERALRAYEREDPLPPMTQEQRQWCITEAVHYGEGSETREDLQTLDDQQLAHATLWAMVAYVQSNM